jgi:hypothetical protein
VSEHSGIIRGPARPVRAAAVVACFPTIFGVASSAAAARPRRAAVSSSGGGPPWCCCYAGLPPRPFPGCCCSNRSVSVPPPPSSRGGRYWWLLFVDDDHDDDAGRMKSWLSTTTKNRYPRIYRCRSGQCLRVDNVVPVLKTTPAAAAPPDGRLPPRRTATGRVLEYKTASSRGKTVSRRGNSKSWHDDVTVRASGSKRNTSIYHTPGVLVCVRLSLVASGRGTGCCFNIQTEYVKVQ